MGSLHLDAEDEPRRGASRANSVRFDERALQGQFGHGSRSSAEFLPLRTGSAFGSHPLTERSSSHKSDGRQSSAGQSVHSARASSFGVESRPLSATVPPFVPLGPPPGLFILGPVPSIIRCWLSTHFTNDSLLYAVVCTASYKSILNYALVSRLGYQDQIAVNRDGFQTIRLPVYLPEATVQQSSSRPNSPAHQLPTLATDFVVQDLGTDANAIQIFLGCDVLRARNADIHFSLDRLTLLDDDRNKLSVPLVRPENTALYQRLQTFYAKDATTDLHNSHRSQHSFKDVAGKVKDDEVQTDSDKESVSRETEDTRGENPTRETTNPSTVIGEGRRTATPHSTTEHTTEATPKTEYRDYANLQRNSTPEASTKSDGGNVWGSWRRDSGVGSRQEGSLGGNSTSGYQRAGRGRGMKVLKPARLNTSRSSSAQQTSLGAEGMARSGSPIEKGENQTPGTERRTFTGEPRPPLSATSSSKPRSANPVGGASAFGWLNSNSGKASE